MGRRPIPRRIPKGMDDAERARWLNAQRQQRHRARHTDERIAAKKLAKHAVKRARRENRIAAMAGRTERARQTLGTMARIYNVVVIDPPWRFEVRNRGTGLDRSPDNHYPTMELSEIEDLGAMIPAAPDCVIGLWATVPMLADAMRILTAVWRFDYVTTITWNKRTKDMRKVRRGLGYVARNTTEHLIIGKRGRPPWAIPGEQWDSSFDAPVLAHSVKPDEPYAFLRNQFLNVPRLEMFTRTPHDGFNPWGNEVEDAATD